MENKLTAKQEKFAQCVASGMTQCDAYKTAFNMRPTAKPETAHEKGSMLMAREDIRKRVEELRIPIVKKVGVTLERHIETLQELRDLAKADKKWQSAISAEISIGKACGLYTEKVEVGNIDGKAFKTEQNLSKLSDDELQLLMNIRDKIDNGSDGENNGK